MFISVGLTIVYTTETDDDGSNTDQTLTLKRTHEKEERARIWWGVGGGQIWGKNSVLVNIKSHGGAKDPPPLCTTVEI